MGQRSIWSSLLRSASCRWRVSAGLPRGVLSIMLTCRYRRARTSRMWSSPYRWSWACPGMMEAATGSSFRDSRQVTRSICLLDNLAGEQNLIFGSSAHERTRRRGNCRSPPAPMSGRSSACWCDGINRTPTRGCGMNDWINGRRRIIGFQSRPVMKRKSSLERGWPSASSRKAAPAELNSEHRKSIVILTGERTMPGRWIVGEPSVNRMIYAHEAPTMRLPRMTTRRWMIVVAIVAVIVAGEMMRGRWAYYRSKVWEHLARS